MSVEALVGPIDGSDPHGEDCGYSLELQAMEALAEYLSERAGLEELRRQARAPFSGENEESDRRNAEAFLADGERRVNTLAANAKELVGRTVTPEVACDFIVSRGTELLTRRGKDLRVVKALGVAWLQLRGPEGLLDTARLFEALLDAYPDTAYPQPDEDDPTDVSARAMVVSEIIAGKGYLHLLRESRLLSSPAGDVAMRDAEVIDGQLEADPDRPVSLDHVLGVVRLNLAREQGVSPDAVDDEAIRQRLESLQGLLAQTAQSLTQLVRRFDPGSIRGDSVQSAVSLMARLLSDAADNRAASAASAAVDAALGGGAGSAPGTAGRPAGVAMTAGAATLATREDARRQILAICAFLEATEPSHPAPLFLRRAERLLGARDFFEIVRDMTPDALDEVTRITGHRPPE